GVCAYTSVSVVGPDLTTIKSDIGSNGTIDTSQMSQAGTYVVAGVSGKFTGKAVASSTITCNGACSGQIQGGAFPSSSGTICSALTVPTFTPGATALNITSGYTMNSGTGYSWGNVTMPDSGSSGSCGNSYNTLSIQAGASGTNTVVQFNTLTMGYCTRLAVLGAGNIELRIGKATLNGITTGGYGSSPNDVHFGVTSADTGSVLAPLAAGQLTVWVNSNCTPPGCACAQNPPQGQTSCAAQISHIAGSAIFNVPNGSLNYDDSCPAYGTATAKTILFSGCAQLDASGFMSSPYTNFYNLRSWKDE
ncbi:MAG TPA: hypothetical protein VEW91_06805, partial [bacterium]|nr:hypothetical protein [bacterium]